VTDLTPDNPPTPAIPPGPGIAAGPESAGGGVWRAAAGLARACHPGPTVAVTALVTALAAATGRDPGGCVLVAAAILTGQLSVGWCNDAIDAGRDAAAGRAGKPVAGGMVGARTVWIAALVALACCVPLSFASGPLAGGFHLAGVLGAWGYDFGLKATIFSWAPYAVGFGVLPAFVTLGLPGEPWPAWWAVAAAALLGVGAHLANVLPDIEGDLETGVRGWPQRMGAARVRLLVPLPLLAATCLLVFGPRTTAPDVAPGVTPGMAPGVVPGVAGWLTLAAAAALAATGLLTAARSARVPFVTAVAVAAVDVILLLTGGASLTA
jgi:4-hydroxybenzoate polyprenyltransferase